MVTLLPSFFPSRLRGFVDIFFPKTVAHPSCKINSATYDVPVRLSINLNLSPLFSTAISCISSRAIFGWILFELNSSCGDLGERVEVFCLLSEYCRLNHTLCSQPFSSKQKTSASVPPIPSSCLIHLLQPQHRSHLLRVNKHIMNLCQHFCIIEYPCKSN